MRQEVTECEKIVSIVLDHINGQDLESLKPHIADNFACAGQTGGIALVVLTEIVKQLNIKFLNLKLTDKNYSEDDLILTYEFELQDKGTKNIFFTIDSECKIKTVDFHSIGVKVLKSNAEVKQDERQIINIPFQNHKNAIIVDATANGISGKFVIDNGSPRLILNGKYFAADNNAVANLSNVQSFTGSISGMDITKITDFEFNGLTLNNADVLTADISHLEEYIGCKLHGLIGCEIYKDYDLLFDYKNNIFSLIKPEITPSYIAANISAEETIEIPLEMFKHIAVLKGAIGGIELNLGIDCGATSNLLKHELFELLQSRLQNIRNEKVFGASDSKDVLKAEIDLITIGSKEFSNVRTCLAS